MRCRSDQMRCPTGEYSLFSLTGDQVRCRTDFGPGEVLYKGPDEVPYKCVQFIFSNRGPDEVPYRPGEVLCRGVQFIFQTVEQVRCRTDANIITITVDPAFVNM
ncbi:hypothetical protein Bbelb_316960 [Branchiostoma belcheri]|nr:hypothetical protein Bbelb_316960 [Branchiostoma belcheri]